MGSCFSKCKHKRKRQEECDHVQDKLVISQAPISPLPLSSTKQSLSTTHSPISSSSVSSSSCITGNSTSSSYSLNSSSSSSSSCPSSIISAKERSFSNEFLWSCVKENPHLIHIDPAKGGLQKPKVHAQKLDSPAKPNAVPVKQSIDSIQLRHVGSTPHKRARANSPTLSRQKSFRREPERPNSAHSLPSRTLRSPSPSRRFSGNNYRGGLSHTPRESYCSVVSKAKVVNSGLSSVKKENFRPSSPNNNLGTNRPCVMHRETCTYQIGSKIDEIAVGKVLSNQDMDAIPMEDIDNPLIALDCFIFL